MQADLAVAVRQQLIQHVLAIKSLREMSDVL
jgi:hypothetical protein